VKEGMIFESIFKRGEERTEDTEGFIELETIGEEGRKTNIRIETLNDYRDVENIQKYVREGNIVFLRIRKIKERDMGELKRVVERLRRTSIATNGDLIGVDEDFLIMTPPSVKIFRGEVTEPKVE
jgi:SepF-like predicted cell division protein (DUF552 family)